MNIENHKTELIHEEAPKPDRDSDYWNKMNKDLYAVELGSKEEALLEDKMYSYLREQIPKIDSIERGKFLLTKLGTNKEKVLEENLLRSKIEGRIAEIYINEDDLSGLKEFLPKCRAKNEIILKLVEKSDDFETLWELASTVKTISEAKNSPEGKIRNIAIRKMINLPEISLKKLGEIKMILVDEGSEEEKMLGMKISELKK